MHYILHLYRHSCIYITCSKNLSKKNVNNILNQFQILTLFSLPRGLKIFDFKVVFYVSYG